MDSVDIQPTIADQDELRQHYGPVSGLAEKKVLDYIDPHSRNFIAMSPFHVLATAGDDGSADASRAAMRPASSSCWTSARC